jgi:hypothetical protein
MVYPVPTRERVFVPMKLANSPFTPAFITSVGLWLAAAWPSSGATIQWTNTAGGNWSVALNWNPHQVPGPGDVARITLSTASRLVVVLDVDATVAGLTMNGSAHAVRVNGKVFNVNGPMALGANQEITLDSGQLVGSDATQVSGGTIVWSGGGITGPLSLNSTNTLQLKGVVGNLYDLQGALTNAGTIQVITGNLRFRQGQLYNLAGGQLDFTSDSDLANYNQGTELLNNLGTVRKSGGTGVTTVDVPFWNQGTVYAAQGTFDWSNGGILDPGSVFTGGGTNQFSGGTFAINTSVNIANARLAGANVFGANGTIDGSWIWTSGSLGQADATLTLAAGGVLTLKAINGSPYDLLGAVTNAGTIQILSGNIRCRGGQIYNLPGALLNFQSDSDLVNYNQGSELLNNLGTIRKSGGTGLSTVDVPFNNQGSIDAVQGTLDWSNGGSFGPGSLFTGSGTNQFSGGTFAITSVINVPNARLAGAALSGGNGTLAGSWIWTSGYLGQTDGTLTLAATGTLTLKGGVGNPYDQEGALTNAGTIQILSGNWRVRSGQIYNLAGALIDFQSDSDVANYNSGTESLNNQGTIRKSGGTGLSTVDVPFNNQGSIDAVQGTLDWSNGGSFGPGSLFTGTGTNQFSGGSFAIVTALNIPNARLAGASLEGANGTLAGSWIWTSGYLGQTDGTLTLAANGTLTLKGGVGNPYDQAGAFTNAGTIQILTGNWRVRNGQIYNLAGALIDFQSDSDMVNYNSGTESLNNQGTIRKSGGTALSSVDVPVSNQGRIDAVQGTLDWTAGGSLGPGSTFTGSGTNQFSGGTLAVNTSIAIPNARLAGATLAGANAAVHGSWIWTSGIFGVAGGAIGLGNDAQLTLRGTIGSPYDLGGAVTNLGTIQLVRGDLRFRDGQLYNLAGGLLDFQSESDLGNYGAGSELVQNLGTVRKSLGTGTNSVDVPFTNRGTLDVQTGAVTFNRAYDLTGGRINCALNGAGSSGQVILPGAASLKGTFSANLNGYTPATGDTFTVVRFGSSAGIFSGVVLPGGFTWQTNYNATTFTLKVIGSAVVPQFLIGIDLKPGLPHLSWTNNPGERFQTQYRDSLGGGTWNNVGPILEPTGNSTDFTDASAVGVLTRFYRVEKLP